MNNGAVPHKQFTVGLMFNAEYSQVALIEKIKPKWQFGQLNGIGGKIESEEQAVQSMVREFREETGFDTFTHEWKKFCCYTNTHREAIVHFFRMNSPKKDLIDILRSPEEEQVRIVDPDRLPNGLVYNLYWMIPFAKQSMHYELPIYFNGGM